MGWCCRSEMYCSDMVFVTCVWKYIYLSMKAKMGRRNTYILNKCSMGKV